MTLLIPNKSYGTCGKLNNKYLLFSYLSISCSFSSFYLDSTDMNIVTKFFNCSILKDGKILERDLWVVDGQIANPETIFYDCKKIPDIEVDCLGSLITPGFIDLQING